MKDHDLLEAIGGIDEKFIENAKKPVKVRKINYSTFFPVAAACIILAAASGVFIPQMLSDKSGDMRIMSETENEPQNDDAVQILSEPGSDMSIATADESAHENYADALADFLPIAGTTKGYELFEEKLHLSDGVSSFAWISDEDYLRGNLSYEQADISLKDWNDFLAAADSGVFEIFLHHTTGEAEKAKIAHLVLYMSDGSVYSFFLTPGGYMGYDGLDGYCVKIPSEVFDVIYGACSK
ncbi:MAG: hypothetical protein K5858_09945 [Lachnospiraceae bacterium]|nr:hypothetical protein [Lachnospiraceae bacterium]